MVNEAGTPVANARVTAVNLSRRVVGMSTADGQFSITITWVPMQTAVLAQNESGELQALYQFDRSAGRYPQPIRLTLQKAKEVAITVVDPTNKPIAGARVGLNARFQFLPSLIAEQSSDDNGSVVLRVPNDASLDAAFAVKRDVGVNFNYLTPGPVEPQKIVLGNNLSFQVRVVDDEDQPLAGVEIAPTSVSKGQGVSNFQLGETAELRVKTDGAGLATIGTLPADIARPIFNLTLTGHRTVQGIRFDPRSPAKEVTAALAPLVRLRGRVTTSDGKPAARAEVHAFGAGYLNGAAGGSSRLGLTAGDGCAHFQTRCDGEGAFNFEIARNHYYAVLAATAGASMAAGGKSRPILGGSLASRGT